MTTPYREHRNIGGAPYVLTWDAAHVCWSVCPAGPTSMERVSRSYAVYCTADGSPLRCSCPDNHYRGRRCKHMRAAAALQWELNPAAARANMERLIDAVWRAGATPEQLAALRTELEKEVTADAPSAA
jgi:hypothetical protein